MMIDRVAGAGRHRSLQGNAGAYGSDHSTRLRSSDVARDAKLGTITPAQPETAIESIGQFPGRNRLAAAGKGAQARN